MKRLLTFVLIMITLSTTAQNDTLEFIESDRISWNKETKEYEQQVNETVYMRVILTKDRSNMECLLVNEHNVLLNELCLINVLDVEQEYITYGTYDSSIGGFYIHIDNKEETAQIHYDSNHTDSLMNTKVAFVAIKY